MSDLTKIGIFLFGTVLVIFSAFTALVVFVLSETNHETKEMTKIIENKAAPACMISHEMLNRHGNNLLEPNQFLVETRHPDGTLVDSRFVVQCAWGRDNETTSFILEKDSRFIDEPKYVEFVTDLGAGKRAISLSINEKPTCVCSVLTEGGE